MFASRYAWGFGSGAGFEIDLSRVGGEGELGDGGWFSQGGPKGDGCGGGGGWRWDDVACGASDNGLWSSAAGN